MRGWNITDQMRFVLWLWMVRVIEEEVVISDLMGLSSDCSRIQLQDNGAYMLAIMGTRFPFITLPCRSFCHIPKRKQCVLGSLGVVFILIRGRYRERFHLKSNRRVWNTREGIAGRPN